jgi:hypothetical protein
MVIEIRDKSWDIKFFNNWCIREYNQINEVIKRIQKVSQFEMPKIQEKLKAGKINNEQAEEIMIGFENEIKEAASDEFFDKRMDLIQEILESNEYEFDRKWWMRKADASDIMTFITSAYLKDMDKVKKKQVLKNMAR